MADQKPSPKSDRKSSAPRRSRVLWTGETPEDAFKPGSHVLWHGETPELAEANERLRRYTPASLGRSLGEIPDEINKRLRSYKPGSLTLSSQPDEPLRPVSTSVKPSRK